MRIPLVEGRGFEAANPQRLPVAVISRNLAERLWPGESAIGKTIYPDYPEEDPYTIVGVAGNHVAADLMQPPPEFLYVSFLGPYGYVAPPHALTFIARTDVDPLSIAPAVRAEIRALDANVPLANVRTLQSVVDNAGAPTAFAMILLVIAGAVALVLGSVGVYGVLSYIVSQRTNEIGVRVALGAEARDVRAMVLRHAATVVGSGLLLGLAGAAAMTRMMRSVLFGVEPGDPATYAAVGLVLATVALLASYVPARRASRIDPIDALRDG